MNRNGFLVLSAVVIGGLVAPISIELAIAIAIVANCAGAAVSYFTLPRVE